MSGFVRPEVSEALTRWREALLGGAFLAFGLYLSFTSLGALALIGWMVAFAGAIMLYSGVQRGRFRAASGGTGLVELDERQITYFGPGDGASVSLDALRRIEIETNPSRRPKFEWVLYPLGEPPLRIPGDAAGSEAIFDALAALKGADIEAAITASQTNEQQLFVIWQKHLARLH